MGAETPIEASRESSDLARLWTEAVTGYKDKSGVKDVKVLSVEELKASAESNLVRFQGFRHSGDRVDRVRSAFGRHLDSISNCLRMGEAVGGIASAFPPAMPAQFIFAASGRLLDSLAAVKADYDRVEELFDQSSRYFEQLSFLENKGCDSGPLANAIVRLFSAYLSICARVEEMTKHSRFKSWLHALWSLEDQELAEASRRIRTCLEELGQTVGYASYAAIQDTKTAIEATKDTVSREARSIETVVGDQVGGIKAVFQKEFNEFIRKANRLGEKVRPGQEGEDSTKRNSKEPNKADVGDKKYKALRSIKNFFDAKSDVFPGWRDAHKQNAAEQKRLREDFVESTGTWLTDDPVFQKWFQENMPLLWIKGEAGIGKSVLAYACFRKLHEEAKHAAVAYFHFKEDFPHLQSAHNAFACTALQMAESNSRYANKLAATLKEATDSSKDLSPWKHLFLSRFVRSSPNSVGPSVSADQVYLIFDGLDEAQEHQRTVFLQFLRDLMESKSRVSVLVTGRDEEAHAVESLRPLTIHVTKERMTNDIKAVISNRVNSLSPLKQYSLATKRAICLKVAKAADGMLYAEHMVRRLAYIGRRATVRAGLSHMPSNLHDLYRLMLQETGRNRSPEQYDTLQRLFAWLAFSKRSLTLAEALALVKLTARGDSLDLEEEINGRSARILEVTRVGYLDEDTRENEQDEQDERTDEPDDDPEMELDEYRKAILTFDDRPLRQYFRDINIGAEDEDLRTPARAAHFTILTMCIELLINHAKQGDTGGKSELMDYAARYWHEHLSELDPDTATDQDVTLVLSSLYQILANEHNVAHIFERDAYVEDVYPEERSGGTKPWYAKIHLWAARGASLGVNCFKPEMEQWIQETTRTPQRVLLALAKGHVENWFTEFEAFGIAEVYKYAKAAVKLSLGLEQMDDGSPEEIESVANSFGFKKGDAKALRAIGTTCFYNLSGKETLAKIGPIVLEHLHKSIELTGEDNFQRAASLYILAEFYTGIDDHRGELDALDAALEICSKLKPQEEIRILGDKTTKVPFLSWWPYAQKARCLAKLGDSDGALALYDKARAVATADKETITLYHLRWMSDVLNESNDPDGRRLVHTLKSWTTKERTSWIEGCLQNWTDSDRLMKLYRAAKLTGETEVVLEWLRASTRRFTSSPLTLFNLKEALADFHLLSLQDVEGAKEIMYNALTRTEEGVEDDILDTQISRLRLDLAEMIFSQFRASSDPHHKDILLQEMRDLPPKDSDFVFQESYIGMLIANMLRIMGPAREHQKYLDDIFHACITNLEDDALENDSYSLRLLVRVLGSLEDMRHDAQIAISAQFSILDPATQTETEAGSPPRKEQSRASDGTKEGPSPWAAVETSQGRAGLGEGGAEDAGPDIGEATPAYPAHVENGLSTTQVDARTLESKQVSKSDKSDVQERTPTTSRSPQTTPTLPAEDIMGKDWRIYCDGCNRSIYSWTEPFFLCLICPNVDLCVPCHEKRVSHRSSVPDSQQNTWMPFCGDNHCYIKGPMKRWKGIKDGVIRIGDVRLTVKQWIKGMKEERWPRAWERYWLRREGLGDIVDDG